MISCRDVLILSVFAFQSLRATLPERSVSPSGQFVIYGLDARLRGAISELAESTKANVLALLRRSDAWRTPLIINLQLRRANWPEVPLTALRFSQTGFGLKLQLNLVVDPSLDGAEVERELLRAIMLEITYRRHPDTAPGTPFAEPPEWLIEGMLALAAGRDRELLLEALLLSNRPMPLEEFLLQRPASLESPVRLLYRAHSMALVQLLLDETEGPVRLGRYIDDLGCASSNPVAELAAHFPGFGTGVEKNWRRGVLLLSARQSYQLLSFGETSERLDELLKLETLDSGHRSKRIPLDNLWQRKLFPAERAALNLRGQNLLLLASRAHPFLRPIVEEYQQIAALLLSGKRRKLGERIADLKVTRAGICARMSEIDDYMNWFEATQLKTQSGVFTNYLSAAQEQNNAHPRRQDALSIYLDSLADQLEN
jgi:hypothetical protein